MKSLRYIDFYAGLGGWTMALRSACKSLTSSTSPIATPIELECVASFDHSDLCRDVYHANFGGTKKATRIERLECSHVENADVWMMSPPCQPHTRQHTNQARELEDPRSSSFLHLCKLLEEVINPPSLILLENVVGFESSQSWHRFHSVLSKRGFLVGQFVLQPFQVGIPNDRPRFYATAVLESHLRSNHPLCRYLNTNLHTCLPEVNLRKVDDDKTALPPIRDFLDQSCSDKRTSTTDLTVPPEVLNRPSAWCFDIVTPLSQRSACFTSGYGSFVKGTGSVLYEQNVTLDLLDPSQREFSESWAQGMDTNRLRYFSGSELARLMGFDDTFSFPSHISQKQQWKLLGNSLNVQVATRLIQFALQVSNFFIDQDAPGALNNEEPEGTSTLTLSN